MAVDFSQLDSLYEKCGRDYSGESVIFLEGSVGEEMYIILEGEVQIAKTYRDIEVDRQTRLMFGTNTQVLATLGRGDFFGEMALLNETERSATAVALTDVKLIVLTNKHLDQILSGTNKIVLQMLKSLSNRLREADQFPKLVPKPKTVAARKRAETSFLRFKKAVNKIKVARGSEPAAPAVPQMTCPICRKALPQDAKFCLACGADITGEDSE